MLKVLEILVATPEPFPALTLLPVEEGMKASSLGVALGCRLSLEVPSPLFPLPIIQRQGSIPALEIIGGVEGLFLCS